MNPLTVAFVVLVTLHRPGVPPDNEVSLNPRHVLSLTPPRDHGHFNGAVHCLVHTADNKTLQVVESCRKVRELFDASRRRPVG